MSNTPFDPNKIIDYSVDYYAVMGLERGSLPEGTTRAERQEVQEILERAYREQVKRAHPHFGGSNEAFKQLIRAKWILEDPLMRKMYESGGAEKLQTVEGDNTTSGFEVDWSKLGTYRKGTSADTVGYGLFLQLCKRAEELGLVPAFHPELPEHNYEWDWKLKDSEDKLSLALVHDENDVLRLTGGEDAGSSLPFKIYFCIPRRSMAFAYDKSERVQDERTGRWHFIKGKVVAATFSDYSLLETTQLTDAYAYISAGGELERHLAAFRDGTLVRKQEQIDRENQQMKWVNKDKMQEIDLDALKAVMRANTFVVTPDPHAADFLDRLPDSPPRSKG